MTLDEAIKHCQEMVDVNMATSELAEIQGCDNTSRRCYECAEEHRQLAEWLKELKALRAKPWVKDLPPTSCEDAISRDKAVVQLYHNKTGDDDVDVIIERDIATIKMLPSVTPKQKTGEWIKLEDRPPEATKDVLVRLSDGEVTCANMCCGKYTGIDFFESISGEPIDDVIEWREIPE